MVPITSAAARRNVESLYHGLALREDPQQPVDGHVQQHVHDEREQVRRHQPKPTDPGIDQQSVERRKEWRAERVDELLEARGLPRAKRVQEDLEPDHAVYQIKEVVDDLRDTGGHMAALDLGVARFDIAQRL